MTMELATITMDRDEALDRYHQYRDANKKHWRAEFDQIKRCYRELSKGARLIDIDVAVAAGGTVTKTVEHSGYRDKEWRMWTADHVLPALAIARACGKRTGNTYSHATPRCYAISPATSTK